MLSKMKPEEIYPFLLGMMYQLACDMHEEESPENKMILAKKYLKYMLERVAYK